MELVHVHERRGVKDVIAYPTSTEFAVHPIDAQTRSSVIPFENSYTIGCSKCRWQGCSQCRARRSDRLAEQVRLTSVPEAPIVNPRAAIVSPTTQQDAEMELAEINPEPAEMEPAELGMEPAPAELGMEPAELGTGANDGTGADDVPPTLSRIRVVKGFIDILDWKSMKDAERKVQAIVLVKSEHNNSGQPFWIKLRTLLELNIYTNTQRPKILETIKAGFEQHKHLAPLFSRATVKFDDVYLSGVIASLDFESDELESDDHYGMIFDNGSYGFYSKNEIDNEPYGIASIKSLVHMCSLVPLSLKHLRINSILGWDTTCWMINNEFFEPIEKAHGPFDVDACCSQNGSNKLVDKFWFNAN